MTKNILILSCGSRNKIVQYFRKAVKNDGKVVVTDCSEFAPALYEADKFYIVPCITEPDYIDEILKICTKEKISGVLSLIDPELSLLAMNAEKFKTIGTMVIGSDHHICEMSLNKYSMYQWLKKHKYKCAETWNDKNEFYKAAADKNIKYPVFVKPCTGSASISISTAYDKETVELLINHNNDLIIQEFLHGQEIGADVYVDMISGEVVSIFTKKKLKMRAGETDKAISIKNVKLFALIEQFVTEAGYRGPIDIDLFDIEGKYYISEVNPRFGGGYPHAYECGCNYIDLILKNIEGKCNARRIGMYEDNVYMMKYNEIKMI